MMNLYERHGYLNKDIDFLTSYVIREYDMKSGGLHVLIRENALDYSEINYLLSLPKLERNIQLGLKIRDNPELANIQNKGFVRARKDFYNANNIEDEDILSIKKDAIYLINKKASILKFDNVEFREANNYTSYYHINNMEFYFKNSMNIKNCILDVKGLSDEIIPYHEYYMFGFLKSIFKAAEDFDKEYVMKKIKRFAQVYKNKELEIGYYREMNNENIFRLKDVKVSQRDIGIDNCGDVEILDISHNYMHYIVPLIKIFF